MGLRRGKRWNSCLAWFLTSVGALCVTVSCIGASDETKSENVAFFSQSENGIPRGESIPSSTSTDKDENVAERYVLAILQFNYEICCALKQCKVSKDCFTCV